jgi:hypothetical protein
MARLDGIIKFTGAIGDLVAYQFNGEWIIRRKSAIPKERIKKDTAFKRTRESNQEFGGASTIAKELRRQWNHILIRDKDNTLHHRLNSIILKMIQAGSGERGKRQFLWSDMVNDFDPVNLNNAIEPNKYVSELPKVSLNNNQFTVKFNHLQLNIAPKGTTHYKVTVHLNTLNNFEFNTVKNKYIPSTDINEVYVIETPILNGSEEYNEIILQPTEVNCAWSVAISLVFYQETNGEFYPLAECPFTWQNICAY